MQERPNISRDLQLVIDEMIYAGHLPAAKRINEVHLAKKLGVSRTPIREALHMLAAENVVDCVPRHGFYVLPLTKEEFCDIYSIRPILDPAALELAGLPSAKQIEKLESLDAKLLKTTNVNIAIDLDDAWHLELLADCPNKVLMNMIHQMIRRTRRYELAYLREQHNIHVAILEHADIIEALRRGSIRSACTALRRNLTSGYAPILKWINSINNSERAQST